MIAYLQGKDVTVDVPDDIGDKELGDFAKNFSSHVDDNEPTPSVPTANKQSTPSLNANSSPGGEAVKSAPTNNWTPNFYQSYIKPALAAVLPFQAIDTAAESPEMQNVAGKVAETAGNAVLNAPPELGPAALPGELASHPETSAFTGKAADAFTFGLTKPVLDPLLEKDYADHPVWAAGGQLTGDLGSLLATGGALKIAGLGAKAAGIGAEAAESLASAPRFLPRAIMTGATFGTKTFVEKTVQAFQDGNVDPAEFGKAVLLQSVGGAAFGTIGGLANMPTAVASAAGIMFTMSKMEGGSNHEAALSAAVGAAFEMVGSFGRSEALNREAIQTISDSIANYARTQEPGLSEETASRIGAEVVRREAQKVGGVESIVKGETGKENTLQLIEDINQKIRQGKIQEPMATEQPKIGTETASTEVQPAETPTPGAPSPTPQALPSTGENLPPSTESGPASEANQNTVFQPTSVSSNPSIAKHPDFIKMTQDAESVVKHYAELRGVQPSTEFATSLWKEMHDRMGEIMSAPASERLAKIKEIKAEFPDIEREFTTLRDKLWSDRTEGFFNVSVAGKYGHFRPKLGIDSDGKIVPRGTDSPTENAPENDAPVEAKNAPETVAPKEVKPGKVDETGLPIRKPGSVVSSVLAPSGEHVNITHQMVLDEASGLLHDAHQRRGDAGDLEKFVLSNGRLKGFADNEAEEMKDVPVRFKGGNHFPDEMAQMAYDRGLLPEPSADLLRIELKAIKVRGQEPKLADFYGEAQHNLEGYFSGNAEKEPEWLTQNQGGTDEIAAEKRAAYNNMTPEEQKAFTAAQPAYHGSPYKFDKFELQKIGSGEGHQAFGWGMYFAGKKEVAEYYKDALSKNTVFVDGKPVDTSSTVSRFAAETVTQYSGTPGNPFENAIKHLTDRIKSESLDGSAKKMLEDEIAQISEWNKQNVQVKKSGHLYHVDIPDDSSFLDYNAILADQSSSVKLTLEKIAKKLGLKMDPYEITGEQAYEELTQKLGGEEQASRFLAENHIPGLKYLDQGSRNAGLRIISPDQSVSKKWVVGYAPNGPNEFFDNEADARKAYESKKSNTSNYVLFDDKHVKVLSVSEPQVSPYQQELDFSKPAEETSAQDAQHTVRGGFRALMKPHLEVEFKKTGAVMIPNRTIDSPADLAYAFKQLHNEAQENFFLGAVKNNRIVAVEHMGFGTIDQIAVYPYETINLIDKEAADGFFIVHNHPSGEVNPSEEDKHLTNNLKSMMAKNGVEFKGHVIIDDTKFGFIDPDGNVSTHEHKEYAEKQELPILKKHFQWQRSKDTIKNGPPITSPKSAFELFKGIQKSDDEGMVYLLDTQHRILNGVVLPKNQFNAGVIQRLAAAYRAAGVLTVNSGLDQSGYQNLRANLKPSMVNFLDDIAIQGGGYQSKVEQFGEKKPQYVPEGEPENVADRYNRLRKQALDQGLDPAQASKWAKSNLGKPAHNRPAEPAPTQQQFGDAGGVHGFGQGREGENELDFEDESPQTGTSFAQAPGETMAAPHAPKKSRIPSGGIDDTVKDLKASSSEIQNLVAPASAAPLAAEITRENLATLARSFDKAEHALQIASKFFAGRTNQENTEFIDMMEHGAEQPEANLGEKGNTSLGIIARQLRKLLDDKRKEIQGLGKGKLDSFIENYFPHIWEQSENEATNAVKMAAKRPLEGSKGFLKKRTIETFKDGIEAGLTPVSYNPVELTLLKIREMDKYLMAHKTIEAYKKNGLAKYVPVGTDAPEGFIRINDNISTVFKSPMIPIQEAYDKHLMEQLNQVAKNLGIDLERKTSIGGKHWGHSVSNLATPGKPGSITTKFAGPESVLAHEIGHQLDHIYGLRQKFLTPANQPEFRKLADLRYANEEKATEAFKRYVRQGDEKMAVMLEAYIHAPSEFKKVAPNLFKQYSEFLKSDPKLEPLTKIKPSLVLGVNQSEVYAGGNVITGHIYAQADAARIINNYLSPGLQKFALYRAYRVAGNFINQFQLGFSAFHLGFTSVDAAVSKMALAINQLALGHPLRAIGEALQVPFAPVSNIVRGDKVMKAWRGEGHAAIDEVMAQAMEAGGGRARMDQFYATNAWNQMKKYFKAGAPIRGVMQIPMAITELTSKPILEYIVPRQKLGIFSDIIRMEMQHNPNMTHAELRTIAGKAWDSVDNRMGQMVYDNLFWNKTFKDLLMGSVRSVGWNLGTIREVAGGIKDLGSIPWAAARGKKPTLSYRGAYVVGLHIVVGLLGAMYTYLKTGKGPDTLKDYYYPPNGGLDPDGSPSRSAFPSYLKDEYHYSQAPVQTALNKLNPILAMVAQMYANKDFYGVKIRNEDDPLVRQAYQEVAYIVKQMEPFGLRNMQKNVADGNKSLSDIVEPWVGITPAPYDINQSKAQKLAHQIGAEKMAIGGRTQEQADRSALVRDLSKQFQAKMPDAEKNMMDAFKAGKISVNELTDIIRKSRMTPLQRLTSNFSSDELQRVYNVATPEEQAQIGRSLKVKDIRHQAQYAHPKS